LSNTLADFADDDVAGRLPVVQEIKVLNKEIATTYQDTPSTVHRPPSTVTPPTNILEALQQKQNVLTNISKWKKKLEKATHPDEKIRIGKKLVQLAQQKITLETFIQDATAATA
jgi:hypothetical protein